MENIYYACLYEALKYALQHAERKAAINRLKAKIVQIHIAKLARGKVDFKNPGHTPGGTDAPLSTDQAETTKETEG